MTKNRIVLIIGFLLFLLPLLGFTTYQKNFFLVVFGAVLVALSFSNSVSKRKAIPKIRRQKKEVNSSVFVDAHGTSSSDFVPQSESVLPDTTDAGDESKNETAQS